MSKTLRTVGTVAGVAALALTIPGVGAAVGMTALQTSTAIAYASAPSRNMAGRRTR